MVYYFYSTLRPNSTITRIETSFFEAQKGYLSVFKTKFHYNKDWNPNFENQSENQSVL